MKAQLAHRTKKSRAGAVASGPDSDSGLTQAPRILVLLDTDSAWSRGTLRGFMEVAHERGWTILHYRADANLTELVDEWQPAAAVIGPEISEHARAALAPVALVSVNADRSAAWDRVCLSQRRAQSPSSLSIICSAPASGTSARFVLANRRSPWFDSERSKLEHEPRSSCASRAGAAKKA